MPLFVLIRGGGDLATGVALRLFRAGIQTLILELPQPLVVRRAASFAEAVYSSEFQVEGVTACRVEDLDQAFVTLRHGRIPVRVDPDANSFLELRKLLQPEVPIIVVDGRMMKKPPEIDLRAADLFIGLGPGFIAGENCHAVVETNRGHRMGQVIWQGGAEEDTGIPEKVILHSTDRVLRAPADGVLSAQANIGDRLEEGQIIAEVAGVSIQAPFRGVLRGLMHEGIQVWSGLKIGDVDPRDDPRYCYLVSDKSLAVAGGVLEAILSRPGFRRFLWD